MPKKKKEFPRHFDFCPADFTGDMDWQMFNAAQRGIYDTLIYYLYQNGGYCSLDNAAIATLCRCENGNEFELLWEKIKLKFIFKNGRFTHKRVLIEYQKAKKRMELSQRAGVMGAKKRWGSHSKRHSDPIRGANTKLNKTKLNKTISNESVPFTI